MDLEKRFRTKTGYCHIYEDRLILTRDGLVGNISEITFGNGSPQIVVIYGLISIFLISQAYQKGALTGSFLFGMLASVFIYSLLTSHQYAAQKVIERKKIKEIKLIKGIPGLSRSRCAVLFENEQGKMKTRLILLPGSLRRGNQETQKAVDLLQEEGLLGTK